MAIYAVPLALYDLSATLAIAAIIAVLASPFIGPAVIWKIVRTANRRDDPRYSRRPPEAAELF